MKRYVFVCLLAFLPACAVMNKSAVYAEKSMISGYTAWDQHVDNVIAACRDKNLITQHARTQCMGKVPHQHAEIQKAVQTAVAVLRVYWTAVAAGKDPKDLAGILAQLPGILEALPPEYFAGLMKLADKLKKPDMKSLPTN